MITRIEIDGFKSLRDFAVDLEPLTVFIGPNNAGKSNILEAIALLSRLALMPIDEAFKQGRGRAITQFVRLGGEPGRTIRLAVELLLPLSFDEKGVAVPNRCRYELTIERRSRPSGPSEYLGILHESLWALDRANDSWITSHTDLARYVHHAAEKYCILEQVGEDEQERHVRDKPRLDPSMGDWHIPGGHTSLAARRNRLGYHPIELMLSDELMNGLAELQKILHLPSLDDAFQHAVKVGLERLQKESPAKPRARDICTIVADTLSRFHLLHLAPAALRTASERIGPATLEPDGSNLPAVLANLPASLVGEIRADIVSVIPGLSSFEVVTDGDELRIDFILTGGERLPAELTSDGTLRILALLTALRAQPRPAAIGVDELENGIYPGRLRQLLELLQETVALADERETDENDTELAKQVPVQLLLTTHSPVMLDAFRSRLECLRFVDLVRRDKQIVTRARSVGRQTGEDRGRLTVSLREIDQLLQSADSEMVSST